MKTTSGKSVVQVFIGDIRFQKTREALRPRPRVSWHERIPSCTGYPAVDGSFLLPKQLEGENSFKLGSAVALIDKDTSSAFSQQSLSLADYIPTIGGCVVGTSRIDLCIFSLHLNADGTFDVWLDASAALSQLGVPRRTDYRVAVLRPGVPVRISINGKSDFTMSGREQRTFREVELILVHLGHFTSFSFRCQDDLRTEKTVPVHDVKCVDLRAMLR